MALVARALLEEEDVTERVSWLARKIDFDDDDDEDEQQVDQICELSGQHEQLSIFQL